MKLIKIILTNLLIFFSLFVLLDIFFGTWFKNNFAFRLSSERNIDRLYEFNFKNHKGISRYIRDNNAFRIGLDPIYSKDINVVFSGGSTTNQKFLKYEDTIVSGLQKNFPNIKFVNAGIDGLSIKGHINSFEYWFDKIKNLKPKIYIFYIGINDQNLIKQNMKPVDTFEEPSLKNKIKEYLESNSFWYKNFRKLKTYSYLKFGFSKGINKVSTVVYGERNNEKFISYAEFEKKYKINKEYVNLYNGYLDKLTKTVKSRNAEVIYITQISGHGMNEELFSTSNSIMQHCKINDLFCIDLAKESKLDYEDFYDALHLNTKGSLKVINFLTNKLKNFFINL